MNLDKTIIAAVIDHAVLKPEATAADVEKDSKIALQYGIASLIVKPCFVAFAAELLKGSPVKVGTVIGFPHGSPTTKTKVGEAVEAIEHGADELDMVMNVGMLLSGNDEYVRNDMKQVAEAAHSKGILLKVILETALLSDEMKVKACRLAEEAGVDFVKTSTGFNGGGATLQDIALMKASVSDKVKLKASGGIRTLEQAVEYVEAGCSRLGTSATVSILFGGTAGEGSY